MPDKPSTRLKASQSGSGVFPRPVLEPHHRHEPPMPPTLPEMKDDDGGTTGVLPVVPESGDASAEREDDPATGH